MSRQKPWYRKRFGLVVCLSLAIHVVGLLIFGGRVLLQQGGGGAIFQSQPPTLEAEREVDSPSFEESARQEIVMVEALPSEPELPQEAFAPGQTLKISGESGWAPPIRGEGRASGVGLGTRGGSKSELFGLKVGQKKLGAIVDVSGSMRPFLENVLTEVFSNFPDAALVLVDGCGMEEADANPSPAVPPSRSARRRKKDQERKMTNGSRILPHLVELNRPEGVGSAAVSGWGGLRSAYPELFEALQNRKRTWIVVGDGAEAGTRLAFEHLAKEQVHAIYWFSDFADPVDPREGEKAAEIVRGNKIEVYLHPMEGLKNISRWSGQVGAKVIDAKVKESRRP